ncbi:MAG: DUF4254 domain-containing protein [Alistipes sp.]|nr:DUF4254 domain-containing protein [Alistipes sp.]
MFTENAIGIFDRSVADYHRFDDVNHEAQNPYEKGTLDFLLYAKNSIDAVQWHLEDIIRNPSIDPAEALLIKRRIDALNQERTDLVEYIDSWFLNRYGSVTPKPDAKINTETPAWAVDRLSILSLKIYHMRIEAQRTDSDEQQRAACNAKLKVLLEQQRDLSTAIEELLEDIAAGRKYMKTYKQMKMYNDPNLNPVLYGKK